jgi:predicted metal-dependent HD superfamily phosphohydrolase
MNRFELLYEPMIRRLKQELPDNLFYHGVHHTLDVIEASERLGRSENVADNELVLLRTAALYHDSGFLMGEQNHEEKGCEFARKELPGAGFSEEEISMVCGMIMATRYPQHPKSHLEQILCDADLDYLGRPDFFEIGATLYKELIATGRLSSEREWNRLQVNFLNSHRYFTATAVSSRDPLKKENLTKVKNLLVA